MTCQDFWRDFLRGTGRPLDTPMPEAWHFELTEGAANALLDLVLRGVKCATSSSLWGYELEGEPLPQVGNLSIITDWGGEPWCVIETTGVQVIPYRDITFRIARREGEDDTLDSWRRNHEAFFRAEGAELGYAFREDMPVIFEDFQLIWRRAEKRG